jgi:hypothetical protein
MSDFQQVIFSELAKHLKFDNPKIAYVVWQTKGKQCHDFQKDHF